MNLDQGTSDALSRFDDAIFVALLSRILPECSPITLASSMLAIPKTLLTPEARRPRIHQLYMSHASCNWAAGLA